MRVIGVLFLFLGSTIQVYAGWHNLEKVTKVTVRDNYIYVRGENATGYSCVDESNFYGTLNHHSGEPGHKEYYSLALTAQTTGKGLRCYIYQERESGVCVMQNCFIP